MSVPIENVEVNVPIMPTKAVDIVPTLKGEPAEGYDVARTEISPQKVRIAGSNEVLDKVDSLVLAELDISGASSDVSTTRKIINGNGLKIIGLEGDPSVKVAIEKIEEKVLTYKMDEIVFTNLQDGYDINILNKDAVVTVNVKGTTSEINNITNENLKLVADLSDVSMGMNNVKVVASTEQDIDSISLSDDTLRIEIVKSISDSHVKSDENSES
jgi:YbbR domain-containing protein